MYSRYDLVKQTAVSIQCHNLSIKGMSSLYSPTPSTPTFHHHRSFTCTRNALKRSVLGTLIHNFFLFSCHCFRTHTPIRGIEHLSRTISHKYIQFKCHRHYTRLSFFTNLSYLQLKVKGSLSFLDISNQEFAFPFFF